METKILFNGQEYNSVDEMPIEVRYAYQEVLEVLEDKDKNGVPDILEHGAAAGKTRVVVNTRFKVNGQEYENRDDLPAEVQEALAKINTDKGASPMPATPNPMPVIPNPPAEIWPPPSQPIIPPTQNGAKTSDRRFYVALGVIVLLLVIIIGMLVLGAMYLLR